jgi:hypothetical protein
MGGGEPALPLLLVSDLADESGGERAALQALRVFGGCSESRKQLALRQPWCLGIERNGLDYL